MTIASDPMRCHLGGNIVGGDPDSLVPEVWQALIDTFHPVSVLDVGCGEGHAVEWFWEHGVTALGVDGLYENVVGAVMPHQSVHCDFTERPYLFPVSLVWSSEVAEHIREEYLGNYLRTLANGEIIAMTHATPGQGGFHHVNEQPAEYWVEEVCGMGYEQLDAEPFRKLVTDGRKNYFQRTGLLFRRCPGPLIFGTSWVPDQTARWVLEQWLRITRKLNPDTDLQLIDSASPALEDGMLGVRTFRFPDNIGALARGGADGWGRAFCKGVEIAIDGGYDWACFAECDLLFARPVAPIIEKMVRCGVKAACPMATPYNMAETALTFMDVAYLKEIDFIRRYSWETATFEPLIEFRLEEIFGDRFFALPLRGIRDDLKTLTPKNLRIAFPMGMDYLHHCTPAVFRAFLAENGLSDG